MKKDQRIVFLGTPNISATLLKNLYDANFNIVATVTKEDKIRGRNNKVEESPVAIISHSLNIPCFKPHKIIEIFDDLKSLNIDLLLTFSYGQIIPECILQLSKFKPLNLHGSLLPKYRGAAPIQYSLLNGDKETGVTLMEMIKEMDAGDIYGSIPISIEDSDNYTTLSSKIQEAAFKLAIEKLPLFFENKLIPIKQDLSKVTFTKMIKKEDEHLNLSLNSKNFINQIRALSFTPGGFLYLNDEILKIYEAKYYSSLIEGEVGEIIQAYKDKIILQLIDGQVNITLLQRQGKKMMTSSDFNNGYKNLTHQKLK